jgi:ABC-type polysaccharide/polyol phosphate transport system ATPase subunit
MHAALDLHDVAVHFCPTRFQHRSLKQVLASMLKPQPPKIVAALDGVSLTVPAGQCVGIIGRNGAGKSTLLRVLAEIILPTRGHVITHGRVVPLLELGVGFHAEMTGRENCFLAGSLLGMTPSAMQDRLGSIAEFADIGDYLDSPVKHYSSGMYARLAFALATEVDPKILLLDEILGVGDEFFQQKSQKRLCGLMGQGVTTVIVSHNLAFLTARCDRLIWLDRGKIALDGSCDEVARAYHGQAHPNGNFAP